MSQTGLTQAECLKVLQRLQDQRNEFFNRAKEMEKDYDKYAKNETNYFYAKATAMQNAIDVFVALMPGLASAIWES